MLTKYALNVKNFGAVGDGSTDDIAAFQAVTAKARTTSGARIHIPKGTYRLSKAWINDANCVIEGDGNGQNNFGTVLLFDDGAMGFINATIQASPGFVANAEFSTIRHLCIRSAGTTFPGRHGVTAHARLYMENVIVDNWSGKCINISSASDGNNPDGNTLWKASTPYVVGQWVKQLGANRNALSNTTGTLAVSVDGIGGATFTRNISWNTTPSVGDEMIIPSGSAIAGTSNRNVGLWYINAVSAMTITATKYANDPYVIDTGAMTLPVAVIATPITNVSNIQAYVREPNRYFCVQAGTSSSTSPSTTGIGIADGSVIWQSGGASEGIGDGGYLLNCRTVSAGMDGIFLGGDNANTYTISHADIVLCTGWGINDQSFFGTTIIKPEIAACGRGTITNAGAGNHGDMVLIAPYYEGGQLGQKLYSPAMVFGGLDGTAGPQSGDTSARFKGGSITPHSTSFSQSGNTITDSTGGVIAGENIPYAHRLTSNVDGLGLLLGQYDSATDAWILASKVNFPSSLKILGGANAGLVQASGGLVLPAGPGLSGAGFNPGLGFAVTYGYPLILSAGGNAFPAGTPIFNQHVATDGILGWIATENCGSGPTWVSGAGPIYPRTTCTPTTPNNYVYVAVNTSAGNSGTDEPGTGSLSGTPWPTTIGLTVTEGGVTWMCFGRTDRGVVELVGNKATTWSGAQRGSISVLTSSSASIAVNLALNNNFSHTLTENTTLAAPTNVVPGQSGVITFTNHASSPKTLAYNAFWKFDGGTIPTLTATNGAIDVFTYYVNASGYATCSLRKGIA